MDKDAVEGITQSFRYRAFISYSHADERLARWLHRRLEGYRIPRRLHGLPGRGGPTPPRLGPVFRDLDELPAATDLSTEVRAALAASASLIVICSPAASSSPWVGREIALFRALHPDRPILATSISGDPTACFPASLIEGGNEPLAATLAGGGEARRLGLLKLIAGMLGIGLDQLVQRDAHRRIRRVMAVTVGAVVAMLVMAVLAVTALAARTEAQRQRNEAEGLVEFMLTDLRQRLKGVGRLDVLAAANRRAIEYYDDQSLDRLGPDSLQRRARILHAIGEDEMTGGQADRALVHFREAWRATAALLARAPDQPEFIFAHGQSEFWVGYVDYQRARFAAALRPFRAYKALSDRLIALAPANMGYVREAGYAEGNLCSIALTPPVQAGEALRACRAALAHMQRAIRISPAADRQALAVDIVNRRAWLADALDAVGDSAGAARQNWLQGASIERLVAADPRNLDLRDVWLIAQFALAKRERLAGARAAARARLIEARRLAERMIRFDPANDMWKLRLARAGEELALLDRATDTRRIP